MTHMLDRTTEKLLSLTISMAPSDARDITRVLLETALDPEDSNMPAVDRAVAHIIVRATDRTNPISVAEGRRLVVAALKAHAAQGEPRT